MAVSVLLVGDQAEPELPKSLRRSQRGQGGGDHFLPSGYLRATATYDLAGPRRSDVALDVHPVSLEEQELVVLELEDGSELFTSAARLAETVGRLHPEWVTEGRVDLGQLSAAASETSQRGAAQVMGGLVRRVFTFLAGNQVDDILADALRDLGMKAVEVGLTWAGTRALMAAVESRLEPGAGFYAWLPEGGGRNPLAVPDPDMLSRAGRDGLPMLVFIHGTASNTVGSFGDLLQGDPALWRTLKAQYPGGIYALEHRTFSQSPIENAIDLAWALPAGARLSLVSHSRGGLVADLLCSTGLGTAADHYRRPGNLRGLGTLEPGSDRSNEVLKDLEQAYAEHREQLTELDGLLKTKRFVVQRYVRVACPAAGTKLASGNFDLFLSGLLNLVGRVSTLAVSPWYGALKRIVIEIAKNRTDPHLVPGLEAMLPDSAMATLLPMLTPVPDLKMAVIAGDIEGGSLLKRLGVFLTDTLFFDADDNDLVVDTRAMLAGIAPAASAVALFDRGPSVSHFDYFENTYTRTALCGWLTQDDTRRIAGFRPLMEVANGEVASASMRGQAGTEDEHAARPARSIAVVLPGIMGTHLKAGDERVWMDLRSIVGGGLSKIAWGTETSAAEPFEGFYGDFCRHLGRTHEVKPFPYDWRQPLDVLADRLAATLRDLMTGSTQPIRLVAHSMGGLVVRACIRKHRDLMDELMARDGARLVMLGTPNHGSHAMVANLIGKADALRMLARADLHHSMQQILDLVGGFRGALQLLPRPGFVDTFQGTDDGGELHHYGEVRTWHALRPRVRDFWFGDGTVAEVGEDALAAGSWLWAEEARSQEQRGLPPAYTSKVAYVFGVAANTPCGIRSDSTHSVLKLVGTTHGDGTVTWDSGRLEGIERYYYLPAGHGDLLSVPSTFNALVELISTGDTTNLSRTPPAVRDAGAPRPVVYDAGPPQALSLHGAAVSLLDGSIHRRRPPGRLRRLSVHVCARDLRFSHAPIMVGHYEHDPIVYAERIIDQELLDGDLTARHQLGQYPGPVGTATAVLRKRRPGGAGRCAIGGAVVTGLGPLDGSLDMERVARATRTGVMRFLMHVVDMLGPDATQPDLQLSSLLLGFNSSASLSIASSLEAIVRGVMDANARFQEVTGSALHVARLEIVELYVDTAITAAYALREMQPRLAPIGPRYNTELACDGELRHGDGARPRLFDASYEGYWPRLIVTGVDPDPERVADWSIPTPSKAVDADRPAFAQTLRYVYVGRRARAEAEMVQRQPGLVEQLVQSQIHTATWDETLGRALFQLLVPPAFKEATRQMQQAVIVVDRTTANIPWELLMADASRSAGRAPKPLAMRTRFVRQLATETFRQIVHQNHTKLALVIGNPSTIGFGEAFSTEARRFPDALDDLPGARSEAVAIAEVLSAQGYNVHALYEDEVAGASTRPVKPGAADAAGRNRGPRAGAIVAKLYEKPWRILHISGHGVYRLRHRDGLLRSGVVMSDGLLITAAEIAAMERVPEIVVLNCCHLGQVDAARRLAKDGNRLAASLAMELIDAGVRCVLVAGWAVNDELAREFGECFYEGLLRDKLPFGEAVFRARHRIYERDPLDITWGAFQAYGEPDWVAHPRSAGASRPGDARFVSPDEFIDELATRRVRAARRAHEDGDAERKASVKDLEAVLDGRCLPAWRDLPEVRSALGAAWFSLGEFERARVELIAALRAEDRSGRVPLRDIELLANSEARLGEQQGDLLLIGSALERLTHIDDLVQADISGDEPVQAAHAERLALMASAHKRMAAVAARALWEAGQHGADDVVRPGVVADLRELLRDSIDAAVATYGDPALRGKEGAVSPYHELNRLALLALRANGSDQLEAARKDAQRARQEAERQLFEQGGFWNAVMVPEARLVERMLDGSWKAEGEKGDAALLDVREAYGEAFRESRGSLAQIDSVVTQWRLLALFMRVLAQEQADQGLARGAARLDELSHAPGPSRPVKSSTAVEAQVSDAGIDLEGS